MSKRTNPRRALIEVALSEDLVYCDLEQMLCQNDIQELVFLIACKIKLKIHTTKKYEFILEMTSTYVFFFRENFERAYIEATEQFYNVKAPQQLATGDFTSFFSKFIFIGIF